jgi:hypothetical protein
MWIQLFSQSASLSGEVGKKSDGSIASARLRLDASPPESIAQARSAKAVRPMVSAMSVIANTNFLPPSLIFMARTPGGWLGPNNGPWIQIGNKTYPDGNPSACASNTPHAAIVLERATLEDADPNTPTNCVLATQVAARSVEPHR